MRRVTVRGVAAVLGLGVAVVIAHLWYVKAELDSARDDIGSLSLDSIDDAGGLREAVDPALASIRNAERVADSPVLGALSGIPAVGDQVRGLRDLTDRIRSLGETGDRALDRIDGALGRTGAPGGRVALATAAVDAVDLVRDHLDSMPPSETDDLVGPLREAARSLDDELADAETDLVELRGRLETARDLLAGPTRVLLLAANNAEARGGMGMHLSAGIVTIEDGDFTTSDFVPTSRLRHLTDGRAAVPEELDRMFGGIWDFGREWRTTSTTPNFPVVGEIFADLSERSPVGEVDIVMSLDVPGLAAILDATGPVAFEEQRITADNVVDLLLRDNYLNLGTLADKPERQELQSRVAGRIFDVVTERDVDVIDLATQIVRAAEGRHVLGWSEDPAVQELWEALGADGSLSPRSFLVAFQNATASKRDYYIDPSVRVVPAGVLEDGSRRFRVDAELPNPVVDPSAPYIDSLNRYVPVGVHRAYVSFTLPGKARDVRVLSGKQSRIGTDGPTVLATVWIRVPEGERRTATIEFVVPPDVRTVELVPSARVQPVTYAFGPTTVEDQVPHTVRLPHVAALAPDEPDVVAAASLVVAFAAALVLVGRSRRLAAPEPDLEGARTDAQLARAMVLFALALAVAAALN